ncbi:MAG: amino acid ABC transporter permease [Oscillospiraceae bacterium]|nr:amino acid ABC transporter permease [Oscillospiraceae bacterium]
MFVSVTLTLLRGFLISCRLFALTLLFSLPLGLLVAFGSMSRLRPVSWLTRAVIWVIRGTPLMLQVIIVYYGPGLLWNLRALPREWAVLLAFVINYACYFGEIFRSGIQSIPQGQFEAAQVLGLTPRETFTHVAALQMLKRILPTLTNEFNTLIKDTALARTIAIKELTMAAQEYIAANALLWPLFYSGVFYLVFGALISALMTAAERKLSYFKV